MMAPVRFEYNVALNLKHRALIPLPGDTKFVRDSISGIPHTLFNLVHNKLVYSFT